MGISQAIAAGLELAKDLLDPDKRAKRKAQNIQKELDELDGEKRQLVQKMYDSPNPDAESRLGAVTRRIIELREKQRRSP